MSVFSEECLGSLVCFLPVGPFHHVQLSSFSWAQQSLLLQIGDEARWLGGAPAWGSSVVFITGASSE